MPRITREELERVAQLARLRLQSEEVESLSADLEAILDYAALLDELDTADVEPTAHVIPLATPLRADTPEEPLTPEAALANAPAADGTAFAVPKVLDGEEGR
jgi:aspartyl-tRNA(Asn)/glutamyl-tRNA(Gln) amidotransferase subunit C